MTGPLFVVRVWLCVCPSLRACVHAHTHARERTHTHTRTPAERRRHDLYGNTTTKFVKCPGVLNDYYTGSHSIDDHNNQRQSKLGLEYAWHTPDWQWRLIVCLIGECATDAFLAYRYFSEDSTVSSREFFSLLARELIDPGAAIPTAGGTQDVAAAGSAPATPLALRSPLSSLYQLDAMQKCKLAKLPMGVKGPNSKDPGKKYQIKQRCAVCARVHKNGKDGNGFTTAHYCVKCSSNVGTVYLCRDGTNGRNCFSWHLNNKLPSSGRKEKKQRRR